MTSSTQTPHWRGWLFLFLLCSSHLISVSDAIQTHHRTINVLKTATVENSIDRRLVSKEIESKAEVEAPPMALIQEQINTKFVEPISTIIIITTVVAVVIAIGVGIWKLGSWIYNMIKSYYQLKKMFRNQGINQECTMSVNSYETASAIYEESQRLLEIGKVHMGKDDIECNKKMKAFCKSVEPINFELMPEKVPLKELRDIWDNMKKIYLPMSKIKEPFTALEAKLIKKKKKLETVKEKLGIKKDDLVEKNEELVGKKEELEKLEKKKRRIE